MWEAHLEQTVTSLRRGGGRTGRLGGSQSPRGGGGGSGVFSRQLDRFEAWDLKINIYQTENYYYLKI